MPLKLIAPEKAPGRRYYYIRGTYLRVRVFQSTGVDRKALANAELERVQGEIERGHFDQPASEPVALPTFATAAAGYLQGCPQSEVTRVKRLLDYFRTTALAKFDKDKIDEGEGALFPGKLESYAAGTLNREYRAVLASVLHHAAGRELMPWVAIDKYPEKQRTKWLEPDQAQRLIAAAAELDAAREKEDDRRLAALLIALFTTGLRITEATRIDWPQVHLARREIGPMVTKNGTEYMIHMGDLLFTAIANLPGKRIAGRKIFGFRDRHAVKYPLSTACEMAGMVKKNAKGEIERDRNGRAKGKTFNLHQARHSFGTWLRRNPEVDLKMMMDLGRWKDVRSVMRYAHVAAHEHAPAIAALPLKLAGKKKRKA